MRFYTQSGIVATHWFYQVGDRWKAVANESEEDWFRDADGERKWTPHPRVLPIDQLPEFGHLYYHTRTGEDQVLQTDILEKVRLLGVRNFSNLDANPVLAAYDHYGKWVSDEATFGRIHPSMTFEDYLDQEIEHMEAYDKHNNQ